MIEIELTPNVKQIRKKPFKTYQNLLRTIENGCGWQVNNMQPRGRSSLKFKIQRPPIRMLSYIYINIAFVRCWLSYKDGFLWAFFAPVIITTTVCNFLVATHPLLRFPNRGVRASNWSWVIITCTNDVTC